MRAALAAFGADAATIDAACRARGPVEFGLWPQNDLPMKVLLAMRTQLRRAGVYGRVVGLDYAVLPWVMRQVGVARRDEPTVFCMLQVAEAELLADLG